MLPSFFASKGRLLKHHFAGAMCGDGKKTDNEQNPTVVGILQSNNETHSFSVFKKDSHFICFRGFFQYIKKKLFKKMLNKLRN